MPGATGDTVGICDISVALAEMAQDLQYTHALLEWQLDARQAILGCPNGSKYLFLGK